MNQIYKVIWSRVKRCYVVVSEIAGRCGKNGAVSEKKSLSFHAFLCALALTGCLMPGVAEASFKGGNGAVVDPNNSIAVGDDAQTAGQYTVALGSRTRATNIYAIAIGDQAKATGQGATAIGSLSLASALHSLAVGDQAHATGQDSSAYGLLSDATGVGSVALGTVAKAHNNNAIAIGNTSTVTGLNSIGIGSLANAAGTQTVVVGRQAHSDAASENSVAIGQGAHAGGQKRVGEQYSASTIAIGNIAYAAENGDVVIGRQATSTVSQYHNHEGSSAVVMGSEAHSYGSRGDVVLGSGAEANIIRKGATNPLDNPEYSQSIAIGSMAKVYGTQAMAIGGDAISIGHSSIAIGGNDIDKVQTDLQAAVPGLWAAGAQNKFERETAALYPGTTLGSAALSTSKYRSNTASIGAASIAMGAMTQSFGIGSTAIGVNSMSKGAASTSIGVIARSWGKNSLAIGSQAGAYGDKSTSLGDTNMVGFDMTDGTTSGAASSAVGTDNKVYGNNSYVIGGGNTIGSATITETTEANGDKIKKVTAGTVKGSTAGAFGYKNTVTTDNAYVVGNNSTASADGAMVLGSSASVTANNGVALGNNTKVTNTGAVAIGTGSETAAAVATPSATINGVAHNFAGVNPASTVSVGKAGAERTITNVAAGRISAASTDAINGSQLYAVTSEIDKGVAYAGDVKAAAAAANKFTRKLGEQTNIVGGVADTSKLTDGNIGVVSNGTDTLNIKLAKDVKVDSVTAGNTVINNNGLTVGGKTYVTNNGINANNAPITNVTSGGTTDSNAANIGDVKKAAAGAKATVTGDKQVTVTNTTAADGHVDYVVSATKTTLAAEAGGKVSVTGGTEDANGVIAYTVGLDAATKTAINNIGGGTIAAGDNKTVTGDTVNTYLNNNYYDKPAMDTKLGDKANTNLDNITNAGKTVINDVAADAVKVVNGKNTTVTPGTENGANGTVKTYAVNVAGDLTGIKSISNQQTTPAGVTTGAKITLGDTTNTVDMGGAKITNVADGDIAPNSKDAVNGGQLNDVKNEVINKGLRFDADNNSEKTNKLGSKVTVNGDNNITTEITQTGDDTKIGVKLNQDINVKTVTATDTVKAGGVTMGGQTVANAAGGNETGNYVAGLDNKTWNIQNPNVVSGRGATEDQLKVVSDEVKKQGANATDYRLVQNASSADGSYTVDTNGDIDLTVEDKNHAGQKETVKLKDIASKSKLDDVIAKGLQFDANVGGVQTNKLGSKVTIKGEGTGSDNDYSGGNLRTFITQDPAGNTTIDVKMKKNLKVETIVATGENGKDGKIGITDEGGQTTNISVTSAGKPGVDGAPGTTRIVYEQPNGTKEEVATLNDGMKYGGDTGNVIKKKLNEQVNVVGGITDTNKLTTEDNLGVVSDGSNNLKVRLAKVLKGLESVTTGDTVMNNSGVTINNGAAGNPVALTKNGLDNGGNKITNVAAGDVSANSTDAVNGSQLHEVKTLAGQHTVVKVDGQENRTDGNLLITKTDNNGQATYDLKLNDELTVGKTGAAGKNGSIGVKGKDGSAVAINGKDGSIGLNGANGANGLTMKSGDAKPAVDGTNVTRLVLEENGKKHDVATLDDGMKYGGDTGAVIKKKLNEQVNVVGGITDTNKLTTEDNLGVVSDGNNNLKVRLAKALKGLESITAGDTFINNNGITISNGAAGKTVSLTKNGLDNGGNKITNLADGVDGTDAVNVSQLKSQGSDIINKGFGIKAEDGNEVKKKLGETVDVVGDGKNISTRVEGGRVRVGLKDDILLNSVTTGRTRMDTDGLTVQDGSGNTAVTVDKDGLKIKDGPSITKSGIDAGGKKIINVAAGEADTDAVNVSQLKKAAASATTKVADGKNTTVTSETNADGSKTYHVNLNDDITLGSDPSKQISIKGTEGTIKAGQVTVNGTAGTVNGLTNKTWDPNNITSGQAATEDQLKVVSGQAGKHSSVTTGSNISVTTGTNANGGTEYKVAVVDTPTFKTVTTGNTVMNSSGLTIKNGPSITQTGVDAGGKRITNVAAGDISANSTDAVNGGQLWKTNQTINNIGGAVNELGDRMDRVGAGAAALAALHPLDFDPDDKWDVAAGYGNYKDAHAVAVGAFYRPNEDTMFSVGGSFGGGENMVNAGVSVKLGQGNHVSTSKVAMAKEIVDLRDENKDLKKRLDTMEQKMNSILGILDMGKKKDFPDVPENHWAYEYVATLAGNGILEGYPDGMFSGERSMTRYEFAAMFYRALKNGAPVDDNMDRAMNEFEPELRQIRLDRIRVDRISGKDNDRNKVERVRVNSEDDKANNDYRDVYGSHISPKA